MTNDMYAIVQTKHATEAHLEHDAVTKWGDEEHLQCESIEHVYETVSGNVVAKFQSGPDLTIEDAELLDCGCEESD